MTLRYLRSQNHVQRRHPATHPGNRDYVGASQNYGDQNAGDNEPDHGLWRASHDQHHHDVDHRHHHHGHDHDHHHGGDHGGLHGRDRVDGHERDGGGDPYTPETPLRSSVCPRSGQGVGGRKVPPNGLFPADVEEVTKEFHEALKPSEDREALRLGKVVKGKHWVFKLDPSMFTEEGRFREEFRSGKGKGELNASSSSSNDKGKGNGEGSSSTASSSKTATAINNDIVNNSGDELALGQDTYPSDDSNSGSETDDSKDSKVAFGRPVCQ
ncbi:hypothetical protein QBC45DRAFT_469477 [Copromyces sp. CBS 386.78]|nr:hypothetical protein QBC45DRAFT_469477 [Copromyces sp. CBS 386.78]